MNVVCRNAFYEKITFVDEDDYSKKLKDFREEYDRNHYCLFRPPNFLGSDNAETVEEFDSTIKLDYDMNFSNVKNNTKLGERYIEEHKFILELFKNYFDMLCISCGSYPDNIKEIIFGS